MTIIDYLDYESQLKDHTLVCVSGVVQFRFDCKFVDTPLNSWEIDYVELGVCIPGSKLSFETTSVIRLSVSQAYKLYCALS